jgi:hypothetical protein
MHKALPARLLPALLVAFWLIIAPAFSQQILIEKGKAKGHIIRSQDADSLTIKASRELQSVLYQMSGVVLPIKEHPGKTKTLRIFIGKSWLPEPLLQRLEADTMNDAFIIISTPQGIWLAGRNPIGDLYAVYTLLEEYLGCMKFAVGEEMIPETSLVAIPDTERLYSPAFHFRIPAFAGRWDPGFSDWHKVSNFNDWGRWWVHSFHRLVPPEVYFDAHPEYFALVDGRRLKDGQLCLGNLELMALLKENLAKEIALNPSATYWSVSQNDCYNYCECELCEKMVEEYGSISGAYIHMCNELATAFPDKQISTLAYQFTRSAPTNIKPLPNVNVMFCSIECNRSMPLTDDPRSADFVNDMRQWAALTENIFVWDYVVQFRNYLTPFPNFHVLQPNIRFFYENGGKMMFQQGSGHAWSDLSDLKQYLIAKLLWNPDLNADSVITRYIANYFGVASPYIQQYFDTIHDRMRHQQLEKRLDIYGFPVFYADIHLTPELLLHYEMLMDSAEEAVKHDPVLWQRVTRTRLPVDFALIDIALNINSKQLPWVLDDRINPEMLRRLDLFVERCNHTGIEAINERKLTPAAYRSYVLNLSERMVAPNKLRTASVRILTPYSPKYPVGGREALTDRLLGGLSYHFNWLGFEGEDMVVVVDFENPVELSNVRMNFMQAVESWIFLPEHLLVEGSTDGVQFNTLAALNIDNTDRNYLDRSVPYRLDLEPAEVRYLRITAKSMRTCPEWHRGFGKPSWIFIDELIVE